MLAISIFHDQQELTNFFLNHHTRPTHLSDWLNSSAATDSIKGLRVSGITKVTKGSFPTKMDSKRWSISMISFRLRSSFSLQDHERKKT